MISDAVVMAAGEGRRLRPLTERWAKPALPIDGRPVVVTLLHGLVAAGVERAWIVVGHLGRQVRALLDGGAFGLELCFVEQPQPLGSADTVRRSLAAGARAPVLVSAADTVYAEGDLGRFARAFGESGAHGAVTVRREPPPGPGRAAVRVERARVLRMIDDDPANPLGGAPLWALSQELLSHLERLPGPPYELAELFQRAIDAGLPIAGVEIGKTRDLTNPLDLVEENFPYLAFARDE